MIATSSNAETMVTMLISYFTISEILYMLALTFQLTAGAMLLIGNKGISKKKIVSDYCVQHRAIRVYPNGDLKDYEEVNEVAKKNWMNQLAFFLLFFGYLISIFGETPQNKIVVFVIVMVLTMILLKIFDIFTDFVSKSYGQINFNEFILDKGSMAIEVPEDREEMLSKK